MLPLSTIDQLYAFIIGSAVQYKCVLKMTT